MHLSELNINGVKNQFQLESTVNLGEQQTKRLQKLCLGYKTHRKADLLPLRRS